MLTQEENDQITKIGRGTPMGTLMREYWVPAMLSSELPTPDSDPVRVMLLGEQLIAFRETSGQIGLIQNLCPHRGASLFFGRNEENGIRCVYHGWKFDAVGNCVDMPNEPAESNFKARVKAVSYPCQERGGIVWAYLGPRETPPPLPDIEANQLPADQTHVGAHARNCNWLQALEGDIDTSHLGFLHLGSVKPEDVREGSFNYYTVNDRRPKYSIVDTPYGSMYGAYRPADEGNYYWRVAQFLFPFYTQIPTGVLGHQVLTRAWVPMDDDHMMFFSMANRDRIPFAGGAEPNRVFGLELQPNTTDWFGRFNLAANESNDYQIDRAMQRSSSFTGIEGIPLQDQAITESMGTVLNRSLEHLGTADIMVARVRNRLQQAALGLVEKQITPPGVDDPEVYRVRSGGAILPKDQDWLEGIGPLLPAYTEHPDLDVSRGS
jgi:phthalate 4,5-dioxygenase